LTNTHVRALAVSGTNLFAATDSSGVFLSTNNGASWTEVNTGLTNPYVYALAVSGTDLFAGTRGGGVFLSTNNGTSWTEVNTGLTNPDVRALVPDLSGNLFAGTSGGGVFISTNNGTNWTQTGLAPYVYALAVSGTNLFAGTPSGVFLSTNNGTSWTAVNTGLTNVGVRALAVSGTNLFAGTEGDGVWLSTNNGASWTEVNTGLTSTEVRALAVSGTNLFAGTYGGGVFLSTDNGTNWTSASDGLTNTFVLSLAFIGTNLFAGTAGGGVFLSTDNGTSWAAVNTGLTNLYVAAFAISGTNLFTGNELGGGVFLSTNNGTSWTEVNTSLMTPIGVTALAVCGTDLFAGTSGRSVWKRPLSEMITSIVDFDIKPQSCPNPLNVKDRGVIPVAILGKVDFDVLNVDPATVQFEGVDPTCWAIEDVTTPVAGDELCDCTTDGPDGFDDLTLKFDAQELVAALGSVNNGDELVLTITGNLLDSTPIEGSDCVIIIAKDNLDKQLVGNSSNVPEEYALFENFPNPFNPSTIIKYSIPELSFVTLKVFDVLGNEIVTLINSEIAAGNYEISWNAERVQSGVYFYRIQAGDFVETKKMVLMK
jgi:photosystem II stability/assembly factor-like uncharacterized protein